MEDRASPMVASRDGGGKLTDTMSSTGEKGSTSELRARIAELEQQLATAERLEGAHTDTEVGLRDALA